MHYSLMFPREFLCAADLRGKDVPLTISKIVTENVRTDSGRERKVVVHFLECEERHRRDKNSLLKRLLLNITNAKTIAKLYGNDTDAWVGKRIVLFGTTCDAFGETVECIRIRDQKPAPAKKGAPVAEPDLRPDSEDDRPGPDPESAEDPGPPDSFYDNQQPKT